MKDPKMFLSNVEMQRSGSITTRAGPALSWGASAEFASQGKRAASAAPAIAVRLRKRRREKQSTVTS